jgi:hypothetical protein
VTLRFSTRTLLHGIDVLEGNFACVVAVDYEAPFEVDSHEHRCWELFVYNRQSLLLLPGNIATEARYSGAVSN